MFLFSFQLVLSFSGKVFSVVVKDMEGMDPAILRGESTAGKKQKVSGE